MTTQEAIEAIQVEGLEIKGKARRFQEFFEGLVIAEEALEKQIPKKPNIHEGFMTVARCPVCNEITAFKNEYCSGCGQKLDWSKRDD